MSKPKLVVDACIAAASGMDDSGSASASQCRDFLVAVRIANLVIVLTPVLKREWDDHESNFASLWRTAMMSRGKIAIRPDAPCEDLQEAVKSHSKDPGTIDAMLKDLHLLEAAIDTDRRIASIDSVVHHFHDLCRNCSQIADVMWADPCQEHKAAVSWVKRDLAQQPSRHLSNRRWRRPR